jgi:NitT/TauT family transport system substrate-binding protein
MRIQHARPFSRRRFLGGLTLAGTAGLLGLRARPVAAEPPPETTRIRLGQTSSICRAPEYVATEFLASEGFSEVRHLSGNFGEVAQALATGAIDISLHFAATLLMHVEAGEPILGLAGLHVGCIELFGTDRVRAIRDLKGKTVSVGGHGLGSPGYVYLAVMAAYVGLNPRKDITWVDDPPAESAQLLAEGKIDAFLAFPPFAQELRAKQIGHVVVNTSSDRPWSQYVCCVVTGNRAFVQKHPVATKRALRAFLKATDICALAPEQVAQSLVDKGFTPSYGYALQVLKELPYNVWREYDPEDAMRFFALRLHEAGMIKQSPQKLIAQGTDWRFLNALKKELKG